MKEKINLVEGVALGSTLTIGLQRTINVGGRMANAISGTLEAANNIGLRIKSNTQILILPWSNIAMVTIHE